MPRSNTIPPARLPLLALALASFGIGTTEYVIMGLLPSVAQDLSVSIPQAGLLVTGYALSVAFGSPWLTVATARMDRRTALLLLAGVFIIGNTLCAISPSYGTLMAARIVTALPRRLLWPWRRRRRRFGRATQEGKCNRHDVCWPHAGQRARRSPWHSTW
jgi:predicted MFS family arabinose efflux permease